MRQETNRTTQTDTGVETPSSDTPASASYIVALIGIAFMLSEWQADANQGPAEIAPPMGRIHIEGRRLYAGRVPWRAWGFNWGIGDHQPVLDYFDNPTRARLAVLTSELRTAHRLGANSMRIPIELDQVMRSPTQARPGILAALKQLLAVAASERVYLDITGNINWRPWHVAEWYERLSERARWQVQANFWRAVAHAAATSPAVLCYELTSEPVVNDHEETYYDGAYGDWTFIQAIGTLYGRSEREVTRNRRGVRCLPASLRAFRVLGLPDRYSRNRRGGGPRIEHVSESARLQGTASDHSTSKASALLTAQWI